MTLLLAALLAFPALMALPAPAGAQTPAQEPGEPATAVELPVEPREPLAARGRFQAPAARAIELAFGATTWSLVRVSTNGAASDLTRYAAQGFYKRELIELVLMSAEAVHPLARSVEDRKKGAKLSQLALNYNLDYAKIVERALAVEEQVDRTYLPLFPERRPRREREE